MKLSYPACFYKDDDCDAYAVVVPDLPGCVSGGDSLAEAILMGIDAASGWVLDELEDGRPAPPASPLNAIQPEPGGFVNLLALDIDEYAKKYGNKTVTKTLTLDLEIPAYLNTFVETQNFDFSKAVQEVIAERYEQHVHA